MRTRRLQQNRQNGFTPTNEERNERARSFRPNAVGANARRGFTLLIAILVIGIILAIGLSILNITLKEYILSNVARESVIALNAADAGMECVLYWDRSAPPNGNKFDVVGESTAPPAGTTFTCMGRPRSTTGAASADVQKFQFSWGTPEVCARVTVTKYYDASNTVNMGGGPPSCPAGGCICPKGVECTRTVSLGYNKACPAGFTDPFADSRTVERGLRALY